MPVSFPPGWYCVASDSEVPAEGLLARRCLGTDVTVTRENGAFRVSGGGRVLPSRASLGLVFAWSAPAGSPDSPPTFELPWARLDDPDWVWSRSAPRTLEVPFERPFCDYFDHWHTRTIHRIPSRDATSAFDRHTCTVSWNAAITPKYTQIPVLRHVPGSITTRSEATLYGLGLAVDELAYVGLSFVDVQTNTPLEDGTIEMRTLVGLRARRLPRFVARGATSAVLKTVEREIANDVRYWKTLTPGRVLERDDESDREMARYADWCAGLRGAA